MRREVASAYAQYDRAVRAEDIFRVGVRDPASIQRAVQTAAERLGSVDIMVCNAGLNVRRPSLEVTESDWDDVWLSEGFATYFTLLFMEHYSGRDAFVAGLNASRARAIATEKTLPGVSVIHDNLSDMNKVLNQLVYQKGGWVLHMLRGVIGTDAFWSGIREYYRRYRDRNAATNDLRRVMEQASGRDLAWFFDEWLTRPVSPSFEGSWRYDPAARQIVVEVNQTQPGEAYRMPVEIGIVSGDGPQPTPRIERVDITAKHNVFTIAADRQPAGLSFDPNTWLLTDRISFGKRPAD